MPDWSRRRFLHTVAAGGALSLAGCTGSRSGSSEEPTVWLSPLDDVQAVKARSSGGTPVFESQEASENEDTNEKAPGVTRGYLLTKDADVDELRFTGVDGAAELQAFVRETDFVAGSVFLLQGTIGECYDRRVVSVYRENDGVDVDLCEDLRPADVECAADAHDVVAIAIRLPLPADDFNSGGVGYGGECPDHPTIPTRTVGDMA